MDDKPVDVKNGILMTMVMPCTNISKEITALVKSAYGQKIKVFDSEIPLSLIDEFPEHPFIVATIRFR